MKTKHTILTALAALMMLGCADETLVEGSSQGEGVVGEYLSVAISLPTTTTTTRANDIFADGLASEYAVNDVMLLVFSSDSYDAEFIHAFPSINLSWSNDTDNDQITTTGYAVFKVNSNARTAITNAYALLVMNSNDLLTAKENGSLIIGSSTFSGTLKQFLQAGTTVISSVSDVTSNGILMTNAPLSSAPGSSTGAPTNDDLMILAPITINDGSFFSSEEDYLEATPILSVCMERAVAKVQVVDDTTSGETVEISANGGEATAEVSFTLDSWALANTNSTSYFLRDVEDIDLSTYGWASYIAKNIYSLGLYDTSVLIANPYRMVGVSSLAACDNLYWTYGNYYRTYFATDPNYSADCAFTNSTSPTWHTLGSNYEYCLENTFDVEHQKVKNTTCAIVKAYLTVTIDGQTLDTYYTINGDRYTVYSEESIENMTSELDDEAIAALEICEYNASEPVYYIVPIKHFGDDLTPWNTWEGYYTDDYTITTADPYGVSADWSYVKGIIGTDYDGQYLGRYGVLRNNWYELCITGVAAIGYNELPDPSDDEGWDDEPYKWINTNVNILSWAVREEEITNLSKR